MSSRINLCLDLDNTLLCSLSFREMKKIKNIENRKLEHIDMGKDYRIFLRPHLQEFLDFVFDNFDITIFTAASQGYASFIIKNIILKKGKKKTKRKIKMFLYDVNCDQSQQLYDKDSPKDLRYLYLFEEMGYRKCNSIILDDLDAVRKANPGQTIPALFFDAKKDSSEKDDFLLRTIEHLKKIKKDYEERGCVLHKN